jgi:hypothetical protein
VDSVEEFEKRRHIVRGVNCDDDVCVSGVCVNRREVWGMMRRKWESVEDLRPKAVVGCVSNFSRQLGFRVTYLILWDI